MRIKERNILTNPEKIRKMQTYSPQILEWIDIGNGSPDANKMVIMLISWNNHDDEFFLSHQDGKNLLLSYRNVNGDYITPSDISNYKIKAWAYVDWPIVNIENFSLKVQEWMKKS